MGDFKYFKESSPSQSSCAVFLNPCFYSVKLYRISNFFYRKKMNVIAKIIWLINRIVFSVDIDFRAQIGKNFVLVHGIGVVIGCDVRIGEGVRIYQGVTLGGCGKQIKVDGEVLTQPIIGDNCIIYTNSCIFGPVRVADHKIVKACSVITQDII